MQIHGLPVPIKTVEMGWTLGEKLGIVITVSHKNKKIVDEYIRVRVEHRVDEPVRKFIDTTDVGGTNKIYFPVKYEKLPNFCLCCGVVGHTTAKFCGVPTELREKNFSIDLKASAHPKNLHTSGASTGRLLEYGSLSVAPGDEEVAGRSKLPEKEIKAVTKAVPKLTVEEAMGAEGSQDEEPSPIDAEMVIASGRADGTDQVAVGVNGDAPSIILSAPVTPAAVAPEEAVDGVPSARQGNMMGSNNMYAGFGLCHFRCLPNTVDHDYVTSVCFGSVGFSSRVIVNRQFGRASGRGRVLRGV